MSAVDAPKEGSREWIARTIRTHRLKASGASPLSVMFSPDAPAEDADLEAADAILAAFTDRA